MLSLRFLPAITVSDAEFSILRRTFLFMGYKPARFLTAWMGDQLSTAFGVLGTFMFSGILHDMCESVSSESAYKEATPISKYPALYFATQEMAKTFHLKSIRFFLLQGVGLLAERVFTQMTGKKVGGALGRCWILLALVLPGADLAHSWYG